jgi:UDP-glucose 6-dehydrogenase
MGNWYLVVGWQSRFGSGYVGLGNGTCYAAAGVVVIRDKGNPAKFTQLQQSECPNDEPRKCSHKLEHTV